MTTQQGFEDLGFSEQILQGVYAYGFEYPSPIQCKAIPHLLAGKDLLAQAQSGTGKTATFTLGSLQRIDPSLASTQAIIISPTRELAEQTHHVMASLGNYLDIVIHKSIGGTAVKDEIDFLRQQAPHAIVGTPGRILQMIEKNYIQLSDLRIFVIDEADEMLKVGFREQLYKIFQFIPKNTQVAIFSATMPPEAVEISKCFLQSPVHILIQDEQLTLDGIAQYYVNVFLEEYKLETLYDIYSKLSVSQAIIFCNSRRKVNLLVEQLKGRNFTVSAIHGDMDVRERSAVYRDFKRGHSRILISTDVLARGIDINSISFVINYDLPRNKEVYIHRIGRSGRYGKKGVAINFITNDELRDIKTLEQFYSTRIVEMPIQFDSHLG